MDKSFHVLAIDDDPIQLELIRVICSTLAYPTVALTTVERAEAGFDVLERMPVDLVITDYRLPDFSGLDVLRHVKEKNPLIAVVVVTAFESTQEAIELMKSGADDYLVKPLRQAELEHLLVRIAERQILQRESAILREDVEHHFKTDFIIFRSREMNDALNVASRSAQSSATVLIRGESGTGKELIAQLIHYTGERKEKPFVTVNVAALPETLVESELFGHRRGAFTGATEDRTGRFEEAEGGTLFIDEIGDITPGVQVKLLRALQFGQVQRVGDNKSINLDVRIIAATNRNLEQMIQEKLFRADLYYRLNVISLDLPPLRKRKSDIPLLVTHFILRFSRKNHKDVSQISHEALDRLMKYEYPGNVRELENMIERAIILSRGPVILERDLPEIVVSSQRNEPTIFDPSSSEPPPGGLDAAMNAYERALLTRALEQSEGNQSAAARLLGVTERRFRSRMELLEVENSYRG